jgi:hypothetical protein
MTELTQLGLITQIEQLVIPYRQLASLDAWAVWVWHQRRRDDHLYRKELKFRMKKCGPFHEEQCSSWDAMALIMPCCWHLSR